MLFLLTHAENRPAIDERSGVLVYDSWRSCATSALTASTAARAAGSSYAVLIADIDRFKQINDTHGHLAGDQVIHAVSEVIRAQLRASDILGRFGGDEFVVLLGPIVDPEASTTVAERIRSAVEDMAVTIDSPRGPRRVDGITVSIGAASLRSLDPSTAPEAIGVDGRAELTRLLWAADAALYQAKRAGRNVVRTRQPEPADGDQ